MKPVKYIIYDGQGAVVRSEHVETLPKKNAGRYIERWHRSGFICDHEYHALVQQNNREGRT